ncbi:MAG: fibronectin type III domain-containing protein, partial [Paludibacteraceae bacterium]|nr:fibronectin type III domain-containing protein [Paludibacteraceae bacterium]
CVAQGATPESWTDVEGTERTLTLHGLTAGTTYDLYVRSNCGAEQSAGAKVSFTPTCPSPTAPVVSGISATGATLSWTAAAGISKYQYIVVERDATEDWTSPTLVEGATTASLTDLTAGTNYDVYVRSYFNETTVSASVKVEFATPCVAMSAISDFNGTFESEIAGSGLMPNCWEAAATYTYENYYSGSTIYPCVKETYSSNTGDKCLAFYGGTNTTKNIALLPVFTEALNTLTISFYYKNGSSYGGTFSLGYYKNGVFTAYEGAANLTVKTSYTQFEFAIPNIAEADGARLAIQYSGGSYSYEAYMDDITITLTPSCAKPSVVTASNIVYDGATIDWTENGSAEEWKVQYSTDNTNWETKNVTAHPYELRGLTTGTPYYVQVIAVCGPTDESPAVAAASTFTPAYIAPTDLAVSATTTTTATFSWTANSGETAWTVQYKKSGDADWTTVENVTVNPYTLTGLTSGSSYQVKVAAGTLYTAAVDFNTECEAISTLPWSADFNGATVGSVPNCWEVVNANGSGQTTITVFSGDYYFSVESNALRFNGRSSYGYAYALLPPFEAATNTLQISFSHKAESTSNSGKIELGYYKDSEFTLLQAYDQSSTMKAEDAYPLTAAPADARIAFRYKSNSSYDYAAVIDDITVEAYVAPSCAAPTALTVNDVTTNSASVSWTSEAASFALEYK